MAQFGIIGKPLTHSFSPAYFARKFEELGLKDYSYSKFELDRVSDFVVLHTAEKELRGLNVTIPYKESIIPYLTRVEGAAKEISAVNTILFNNGERIGYNTDVIGFEKTIAPLLKPHHTKALILGTGGSSKAVAYVLKNLGLEYLFVTSKEENEQPKTVAYNQLSNSTIQQFNIIINCTPLGMYPKISAKPEIPYDGIDNTFLIIDLIYNPEETLLLQEAAARGATVANGYNMLIEQAEASWKIWNG